MASYQAIILKLPYLMPADDNYEQTIYLGHEFEFHYIRLEPMTRQNLNDVTNTDDLSHLPDLSYHEQDIIVSTNDSVLSEDDVAPQPQNETSSENEIDRMPLLCDLPNEVLLNILRQFVGTSYENMWMLKHLFPNSKRFNDLLSEV